MSFEYDPNGNLANLIYEQEAKGQGDSRRPHLGCSQVGRECAREVWYGFRWAGQVVWEGRMLRLFDRGQREEEVLVKALRSIGCEVWEEDSNGKQFRVEFGDGHLSGSVDGVARGVPGAPKTPHLLEFKTHNDRSYKDLLKKGVAESKPQHMVQMQMYMCGLKLKRALYVAVNKNDDSIYTERIEYDPALAKEHISRGLDIIASDRPPPGISTRPDWYKCKFCNFKGQCHSGVPLSMNCRTCENVEVKFGGEWECKLSGDKLSLEEQKKGCKEWKSV